MNQCQYVDWYKFNKRCVISTCKFHSTQVDTCCMAISRAAPGGNKSISDQELRYYKFMGEMTTRGVAVRRKKAIKRTKALIAFHRFVEHIRETYEPIVDYAGGDEVLDLALRGYPFKFKRIGFDPWMLTYLFDPVVYKHFLDEHGRGDNEDLSIQDMLDMTKRDYTKLEHSVIELVRQS
jgi:hypothetical protein